MTTHESIVPANLTASEKQSHVDVDEYHQESIDARSIYTNASSLGQFAVEIDEQYVEVILDEAAARQTWKAINDDDKEYAKTVTPRNGLLYYARVQLRSRLTPLIGYEQSLESKLSEEKLLVERAQLLQDARESCNAVDDKSNIQSVEAALNKTMPAFVRQALQEHGVTWQEWVSEKATDEQLLNVLQANSYIIDQQQTSPEFAEMVNNCKQMFKRVVPELVAMNVLAQPALDTLQRIDSVQTDVGDAFSTLGNGASALYQHDSDRIVIGFGYGQDNDARLDSLQEHVDHTMVHELAHALISSHTKRDDPSHIMHSRWMEEGMTTIVAEIIRTLGGETLSARDKWVYRRETNAIRSITNTPSHPHTTSSELLNDALRAYSGGDAEFDQFSQMIDASKTDEPAGRLERMDARQRAYDLSRGKKERYIV